MMMDAEMYGIIPEHLAQSTSPLASQVLGQLHLVDHGQRDEVPDAVDSQERQSDEDLRPQFGNAEDGDQLREHGRSSRVDSEGERPG
ncbi:MAG: hypothetical protein MUF18_20825 [Fimbriiglobus sp.]|nr:hypothetical protein [Fimbriiglobus sp.]